MSVKTFEPLLGPSPMRPNPSRFVLSGVTWTANLMLKTIQAVDQEGDLLKA